MWAWLKKHTVAVLVGVAIILVAIIVTIFCTVSSGTPSAATTITKVTYSQTQAGTNTAPANIVITSETKIRALQALLTTYNVQPGLTDTLGGSAACVGGLTSNVALDYADGNTAKFSSYVCGNDNPEFSVAISNLLASWAT